MKMVKKILVGMLVLAAALSVTSCMKDDDKNAIKGSGKKYSIDFTNEETDAYRAYKATAMKHAGALVKVTFNAKDCATSKLGVIFDLKDAKSGIKGAKDFYAIAFGMENDGCFYVSQFTDITDIQAKNFGASTTAKAGEPKEVEEVPYNGTRGNKIKFPAAAADGSQSLYIWYQAQYTGSFAWAIYSLTDEEAATYNSQAGALTAAVTPLDAGIITDAFDPLPVTEANKVPQNKIAVYAQVAPGKTLDGKWNFVGTYLEAEDAE